MFISVYLNVFSLTFPPSKPFPTPLLALSLSTLLKDLQATKES